MTTTDDIARLRAVLDWAEDQSNGSRTVDSAKAALDRLAAAGDQILAYEVGGREVSREMRALELRLIAALTEMDNLEHQRDVLSIFLDEETERLIAVEARSVTRVWDKVKEEQDRAELAEAREAALKKALKLAYPYVKDALEAGGMTSEVEALIRTDLNVIGPILAASSEKE